MNNFINNNDLLIQLYKLINNYKKNSKILLACSGGPDSLLCFSLLLQLQHQYNISWGVIVINHKIKKETFSKEENYIKNICYKHNIPLHIKYLNE